MQYIYIILMICMLAYVFLKSRRFDFFTIAGLSTLFYYYPALLGKLRISANSFTPIATEVYICLCVHIITLLVCMMVQDNCKVKKTPAIACALDTQSKKPLDKHEYRAMVALSFVGIVLFFYVFMKYGGFQDTFNKMQLLANANRLTEYLKYIALFTFVYAFSMDFKEGLLLKLTSGILIGYTFLLGHRSFVVLGAIVIFVKHVEGTRTKKPLWYFVKEHKAMFFFMCIAAIFVLFVKNVFAALMTQQYDLVMRRLTDPDYYLDSLLNSEANAILWNLQRVCDSGMTYSVTDYFLIFAALMPVLGTNIMNALGVESFETVLNNNFNEQLSEGIGLGSTFLGEAYATGWYIFVFLAMLGVFFFISFLQRKRVHTHSLINETWIGIVLAYFTFYIHRNSLIFLLIMARAYAYIWLAVWLMKKVRWGKCVHFKKIEENIHENGTNHRHAAFANESQKRS